MNIASFRSHVYGYYNQQGRDLPWRHNPTLYRVFVSEYMLQQTQVSRVIPYFRTFTTLFPSFSSLAHAPLSHVLRVWQGLGYNRRAKYMWEAAKYLADHECDAQYQPEELIKLPGIGRATAGAIVVYAYNIPAVFIETNIRTVFIHHFFKDKSKISDALILPFIEKTLDSDNPRTWYWALMDYGAHLKQRGVRNRTSASYTKQAAFEGSLRQVRGRIIAHLLSHPPATYHSLRSQLPFSDTKIKGALSGLLKDGLIARDKKKRYCCV